MAKSRVCSIPDCGKPVDRKGWCQNHYFRWYRHGDPLGGGTSKGEVQRYYAEVVLTYDGDECLIWPYARLPSGYARMKGHNVHRRLCEDVNGPPPSPEHEAAHSCGNGMNGCVAKRHLSWKTHVENEADKALHGTAARGERQGQSRLMASQVLEIRDSPASGVDLAARYGVSPGHISYIRRGLKWAWLFPPEQPGNGTD